MLNIYNSIYIVINFEIWYNKNNISIKILEKRGIMKKRNRKILGYGILSTIAIATTVAVPVSLTVNYQSQKTALANDLLVLIWEEVQKQVSSLTNLNDVNSIEKNLVDKINEILKTSGVLDTNVTNINIALSPSTDGTTQIAKPITINFSNNITGESEYFDINSNKLISKNPIQTGILNNQTPNGFDLSSVSTNIWEAINSVVNSTWIDINQKTQLEQDLTNKINEITQPLGVTVKSININLEKGETHKVAYPILIEFNENIVGNFGDNFLSSSNSLTTIPPIQTGILNSMTENGIDLSEADSDIYPLIVDKINSITNLDDINTIQQELVTEINKITEPLGATVNGVEISLVNNIDSNIISAMVSVNFAETIVGDNYNNFNLQTHGLITKNSISTATRYISESSINEIKNSFLEINIENYTSYFDNANFLPSDPNIPNVKNSGIMLPETLSSFVSNNNLPVEAISNIVINKVGDTEDGGMLIVNINVSLNSSWYSYDYKTNLVIENVVTGIFDPNSDYNLNKIFVAGGDNNISWVNLTELGLQQEIVYVPYKLINLWWNLDSSGNIVIANSNVRKISYKFCPNLTLAKTGSIKNTFTNFVNLEYVDLTNSNVTFESTVNTFMGCVNLKEVNFTNANKFPYIVTRMFKDCRKLVSLDFSSCTNLTYIYNNAFENCESLTTIDLSGATLSDVNTQSVFANCNNLQTIYVKDAHSQSKINDSLRASNISGVDVIIKN